MKKVVGRKEKFGSSSKREARFFWKGILFASPWLIGFVCFILLPVCLAFYYSFTDYNLFNEPAWVGLKNYKDAFKDQYVWKGLKNTLYMVFISPIVGMVVSLLLALLLNQKNIPGLPFFRTVFYLPSLVPVVASVMLLTWLLNGHYGLVNQILGLIGIEGPAWLNDPKYTKISLMIMDAWRCGGTMIIYLAALRSVPASLYEAAELDGANGIKKFFHITVPCISPTIEFNVSMSMIGAFQYFTQGMLLVSVGGNQINGGPGNSLLFYNLYLYQNAFSYFKMGYACALAVLLFLIVMVTTALTRKLSDRIVNYDVE